MSQVSQGKGFTGVSKRRTAKSKPVDPVYMMAGRLVHLLQCFGGSLHTGSHTTYKAVTNQLLHDRRLNCKDAGATTEEVRRVIVAAFEKLERDKTLRWDDDNGRIVLTPAKRRRGHGRSRQRYTNNPRRSRQLAWT